MQLSATDLKIFVFFSPLVFIFVIAVVHNFVFTLLAKELESLSEQRHYNVDWQFQPYSIFIGCRRLAYVRLLFDGVPREIGIKKEQRKLLRRLRVLSCVLYSLVVLFPTIMNLLILGTPDWKGTWIWWLVFGVCSLILYLRRGKWKKIDETKPYYIP